LAIELVGLADSGGIDWEGGGRAGLAHEDKEHRSGQGDVHL
jgi:hypothetical protein